jgi:hypothetical protein
MDGVVQQLRQQPAHLMYKAVFLATGMVEKVNNNQTSELLA